MGDMQVERDTKGFRLFFSCFGYFKGLKVRVSGISEFIAKKAEVERTESC